MTIHVNNRLSDHAIDPLFLERWSPRAFTGETLPEAELLKLFEAARWAPSAFNAQPWRFIYATRDSANWDKFLGILNPFNQSWAAGASVLVFVVSATQFVPPGASEPVASRSHAFDAGAAWGALALQAARSGLQAHAMTGFDADKARAELGVPESFHINAAVAIGRRGDKSQLPEGLQQRETPSPRKPLEDIVWEGGFKGD